jgi:hypothetical protein
LSAQAARDVVGLVAKRLYRFEDAQAQMFIDAMVVIEDARNRCSGDLSMPGDVINRRVWHKALFAKRQFK